MTSCIDCIEKKVTPPRKAETILINNYDSVRPLCFTCLDDYIQMEGEINLDYYTIKIQGVGKETFIKRINEVLEYLNDMNKRYSDRYFSAKKLGEKWAKTQPDPYDDATIDLPESIRITRKLGQELMEAIKW